MLWTSSLVALVTLTNQSVRQSTYDHVEIKWKPRVGQVWEYMCESGAPIGATSYFYVRSKSLVMVRVKSIERGIVTLESKTTILSSAWDGRDFERASDSFAPLKQERQYNVFAEPKDSAHPFPPSHLRGFLTSVPAGFTFPNSAQFAGTSWALELRTDATEKSDYRGISVCTYVGIEKLMDKTCWKIEYRTLGISSRNRQQCSGIAWLDCNDGSIVRIVEGERPKNNSKFWGDEVVLNTPPYVEVNLIRSTAPAGGPPPFFSSS